ncbi:enoyl-CoA hydratase/isomerase family protein [Micromonospora profundi]|uniref:enoyl-CoA hydratase/isomerase family protein n=1 Tax=Micromonospora profundi TaxID=1420889 RepID=UPI0033A5A009
MMTGTGSVRVDDHPGGVRLLTLDRPETGNALSDDMMAALDSALQVAIREPGVRALVLAGEGRAFCVGADVGELRSSLDLPQGPQAYWRPRLELLAALIETVNSAPIPVICAVHGQAAGSGFALALSCDIRVAADRAAFNFGYGALGSSTDAGLVWLLVRTLGPSRAAGLLLEQPIIRAKAAHTMGIVSDVVAEDDLVPAALRIAASVATGAPHAIAAAKQLVATAQSMPLREHIRLEHAAFLRGFATDDLRRGLTARVAGGFATFSGHTRTDSGVDPAAPR